MKRTLLALLLLLVAPILRAGVTYDFSMATKGGAAPTLSGTASVDGASSRVELTRGDGFLFKDGAIVLSADGGKTLRVLDPKAKTYYTLSFDDLFATAGALMKSMGSMMRLSISNQKVDVKSAGPGEKIEGYATRKYEIATSYDMKMTVLGSEMASSIAMETAIWATPELDADYAVFLQDKSIRTGIEEIDSLIAAQSQGVKGFPLRQITTMRTTQRGKTVEQTTTMTISKIRTGAVDSAAFAIPKDYTEGKSPLQDLQQMKIP
ncbi:MAG TPA: DUF4412 domain-containing protein [Thermoanaerobaculia bacterium]|nr:DUF4412 domain-containing protein [Thermoanaerobaculia bacterium]